MNQLQYPPYPDIQPLPQRNSYNTRETFTQLLTLVAFVLYSYFLFQNYAKGGKYGMVDSTVYIFDYYGRNQLENIVLTHEYFIDCRNPSCIDILVSQCSKNKIKKT